MAGNHVPALNQYTAVVTVNGHDLALLADVFFVAGYDDYCIAGFNFQIVHAYPP